MTRSSFTQRSKSLYRHRGVQSGQDGRINPAELGHTPFAGDDLALKAIMEGTFAYSRNKKQVVSEFNAVVEKRNEAFRKDIMSRLGSGDKDDVSDRLKKDRPAMDFSQEGTSETDDEGEGLNPAAD